MTDNIILGITLGIAALISSTTCIILNKNRRIPHTASFQDDPAGATSDFLILISFILIAMFIIFLVFTPIAEKNKITYCKKFIKENINSSDNRIIEELNYCKEIVNR